MIRNVGEGRQRALRFWARGSSFALAGYILFAIIFQWTAPQNVDRILVEAGTASRLANRFVATSRAAEAIAVSLTERKSFTPASEAKFRKDISQFALQAALDRNASEIGPSSRGLLNSLAVRNFSESTKRFIQVLSKLAAAKSKAEILALAETANKAQDEIADRCDLLEIAIADHAIKSTIEAQQGLFWLKIVQTGVGIAFFLLVGIPLCRALRASVLSVQEAHATLSSQNASYATIMSKLQEERSELKAEHELLAAQSAKFEQSKDDAELKTALHGHSARRFQSLFENLPVGCFTFDTTGQIYEWNSKMSDIFEIQPHEALLRPFPDAIGQPDRAEFLNSKISDVFEYGEIVEFEFAYEKSPGQLAYLEFSMFPLTDTAGNRIGGIGCTIDVTEKQQFIASLAENEKRLDDIVKSSGEFIWEVDGNGLISYISDRVFDVKGYIPAELIGTNSMDYVVPEDRPRLLAMFEKLAATKSSFRDATCRGVKKDGSLFYEKFNGVPILNGQGDIVGYRGSGRDITFQKEAEDAVAEAHEKIRAILESISDSFFALNQDLEFSFVNESACTWLESTRSEVIGRSIDDLIKLDDQGLIDAIRLTGMDNAVRSLETSDKRNGRWYDFHIYPSQAGISVFFQDITIRKSLEDKIQSQMSIVNDTNVQLEIQQMELEEAYRKLEMLASTDGLTGLKNHKTFQDYLKETFHSSKASGEPFGVILLDVDKFKLFNDSFGHPAGDEVLKRVAKCLSECAGQPHMVARYGGEEFVILTRGLDEKATMALADAARLSIASQIWQHRAVTASFGVAMYDPAVEKRSVLVERADRALYAAKESGRNRVVAFSGLALLEQEAVKRSA